MAMGVPRSEVYRGGGGGITQGLVIIYSGLHPSTLQHDIFYTSWPVAVGNVKRNKQSESGHTSARACFSGTTLSFDNLTNLCLVFQGQQDPSSWRCPASGSNGIDFLLHSSSGWRGRFRKCPSRLSLGLQAGVRYVPLCFSLLPNDFF